MSWMLIVVVVDLPDAFAAEFADSVRIAMIELSATCPMLELAGPAEPGLAGPSGDDFAALFCFAGAGAALWTWLRSVLFEALLYRRRPGHPSVEHFSGSQVRGRRRG